MLTAGLIGGCGGGCHRTSHLHRCGAAAQSEPQLAHPHHPLTAPGARSMCSALAPCIRPLAPMPSQSGHAYLVRPGWSRACWNGTTVLPFLASPQHSQWKCVPAQDDDLVQLRERREWLDALTTVKGGVSRSAKVDLRTEAKVRPPPPAPATCRMQSRAPGSPCRGRAECFRTQRQSTSVFRLR